MLYIYHYFPLLNYTLDILKESDSNLLSSDIIICKAFATYKDYNSQVIRTFMIDSNKAQQNQYKILLTAFDKILNSIKDAAKNNKTLGDVYNEIKDFIISKDETLKNCVPECFGYGIGLETSNEYLRITSDSKVPVQKGMVIFIHLSLQNLEYKDKTFMMQIGDTICLDEKGEIIVLREKLIFEDSLINFKNLFYDFIINEEYKEFVNNVCKYNYESNEKSELYE